MAQTVDERLNEHSREIRMLKEVFVPMAKTAMEIIAGKDGQPGMAEVLRGVRDDVQELRQEIANNRQADKDIHIMGMKVSSDVRMSIVNGTFTILAIVATWFLSR